LYSIGISAVYFLFFCIGLAVIAILLAVKKVNAYPQSIGVIVVLMGVPPILLLTAIRKVSMIANVYVRKLTTFL
jgi:hypothetical protein